MPLFSPEAPFLLYNYTNASQWPGQKWRMKPRDERRSKIPSNQAATMTRLSTHADGFGLGTYKNSMCNQGFILNVPALIRKRRDSTKPMMEKTNFMVK